MLSEDMLLLNNSSKLFQKLINQLNLKIALQIGLTVFWAVIIIGTFREFI